MLIAAAYTFCGRVGRKIRDMDIRASGFFEVAQEIVVNLYFNFNSLFCSVLASLWIFFREDT
jgi:hypothetical protein